MGKLHVHIVKGEEEGLRLDVLLSRLPFVSSRSAAAKLLETGRATLNEQAASKNHRVQEGDVGGVVRKEGKQGERGERKHRERAREAPRHGRGALGGSRAPLLRGRRAAGVWGVEFGHGAGGVSGAANHTTNRARKAIPRALSRSGVEARRKTW